MNIFIIGGAGYIGSHMVKISHKTAQGYLFSMCGRIHKNEIINNTMIRIAKDELNIELKLTSRFIGVFEHFYDDSIYKDVLTHYVNLAYEIKKNGTGV